MGRGAVLVVLGVVVGAFDELAVLERRAGSDEGDQMGGVDGSPPALGGLHELEGHRDAGGPDDGQRHA